MMRIFDPAFAWWAGRTERERQLLAGLGVVVAALVAWYGAWTPLQAWSKDAQERLVVATSAVAEAEAAAQEIDRNRGAHAGGVDASPAAVTRSATSAGVVLSKSEPSPGGVTVWAEQADPRLVFTWLGVVRRDLGLGVRTLEVHTGEGGVETRIVFEGGGR